MQSSPVQIERKTTSWLMLTFICTNIIVALVLVFAMMWFGSLASALAYLAGERLIVDTRSKSFGTIEMGKGATLTFHVTNYSGRPITILGSESSCSCVVTSDLPKRILPGERGDLRIDFRNRSLSGWISERATFFTDNPSQTRLILSIRGNVNGEHGRNGRGPEKS